MLSGVDGHAAISPAAAALWLPLRDGPRRTGGHAGPRAAQPKCAGKKQPGALGRLPIAPGCMVTKVPAVRIWRRIIGLIQKCGALAASVEGASEQVGERVRWRHQRAGRRVEEPYMQLDARSGAPSSFGSKCTQKRGLPICFCQIYHANNSSIPVVKTTNIDTPKNWNEDVKNRRWEVWKFSFIRVWPASEMVVYYFLVLLRFPPLLQSLPSINFPPYLILLSMFF